MFKKKTVFAIIALSAVAIGALSTATDFFNEEDEDNLVENPLNENFVMALGALGVLMAFSGLKDIISVVKNR